MSDLIERLRRWSHDVNAVPASDLMDEAADRIELDARTISALIADGQAMKDCIVNGERARWISVTERLPEPDYMGNAVGVLACLPDGEVCIGFCDNDEYGVRWHCQSTKRPTHWMPMPERPEVRK